VLDEEDISKLAQIKYLSLSDFKQSYLIPHEFETSKLLFRELPCPLLENNLCTIYEHRPGECASYPHLHKDDFSERLFNVIENYAICPNVFNVYERLKDELWDSDIFDKDDTFSYYYND